jgi:hypothetical protein
MYTCTHTHIDLCMPKMNREGYVYRLVEHVCVSIQVETKKMISPPTHTCVCSIYLCEVTEIDDD